MSKMGGLGDHEVGGFFYKTQLTEYIHPRFSASADDSADFQVDHGCCFLLH